MNNVEFSNEFDVLYNNITSNQAPGLDEYEKSVFLTKAQYEILKNYFLPQSNPKQAGFDGNQKRQIDFSNIVKSTIGQQYTGLPAADPRAYLYKIPSDILFIINESINIYDVVSYTDSANTIVDTTALAKATLKGIRQIIPISFDEYTRLMSKPYKEPLKNQAWRLIENNFEGSQFVSIIISSIDKKRYGFSNDGKVAKEPSNYLLYNIRYVKRPRPIILADFKDVMGEGISIDGMNGSEDVYKPGSDGTFNPCELNAALHQEILQRAVELAKVAWQGEVQTVTQAGERSE